MLEAKVIRKAAFLFGLALACFSLAPPARAEITFYVAVNGIANVHTERSKQSKNIGELRSGTKLTIPMDECEGWVCIPLTDDYDKGLVLYGNGAYAYGYVRYDMFSLDPPGTYEGKTATVKKRSVTMRYGPSEERTPIRRYDEGTTAHLIARLRNGKDDWFKVRIGEKAGWIRGDLLEFDQDGEDGAP